MEEACAHIIVSGLVQGVGYRYFAARRAEECGITGFVRNLPDGNVEVRAAGNRGMIGDFIAHLRVGPRAARVADIRVEWVEPEEIFTRFEIR